MVMLVARISFAKPGMPLGFHAGGSQKVQVVMVKSCSHACDYKKSPTFPKTLGISEILPFMLHSQCV